MIYSLKKSYTWNVQKFEVKYVCKNKQTQKLIFTLCEKNPQLRKSTISKIRIKMKEKNLGMRILKRKANYNNVLIDYV